VRQYSYLLRISVSVTMWSVSSVVRPPSSADVRWYGFAQSPSATVRSPRRRVKLKVPHFVALGHILQSTDLIATVPERLAQRMTKPFGLHCMKHPVKLPRISINLFWHAKNHKDPANQWLRGTLFDRHAEARQGRARS
jgi:DNA-binding transcriptional LysR family regulator